jgi:DNA-binding MarR family transcriptional regulator
MNAAPFAVETLAQLYARPGFLLRRAHQISAAVFEDACAPLALTQAQYGAMTVLAAAPGLDQTRLARALAYDKVTVMRVLRGLQARGLVERAPVPGNARQLAVQLSVAGHDLLAQAQAAAQAAYQRLLQPLVPEQQRQLVQLLTLLTDGLSHEARAPFVPLVPA